MTEHSLRLTLRLVGGGSLHVAELEEQLFDLSIVAPEGPSAAVYVTHTELVALAGSLRGIVFPAIRTAAASQVSSALGTEFPLLYEMSEQYDFAERLGGCTSPIHAEADAALRELWMARTQPAEVPHD